MLFVGHAHLASLDQPQHCTQVGLRSRRHLTHLDRQLLAFLRILRTGRFVAAENGGRDVDGRELESLELRDELEQELARVGRQIIPIREKESKRGRPDLPLLLIR